MLIKKNNKSLKFRLIFLKKSYMSDKEKFDINININNKINLDTLLFQKMIFIYNALNDGWVVKKKNNLFVFTKNHEGKKEVLLDDYLKRFMEENFDINKIN